MPFYTYSITPITEYSGDPPSPTLGTARLFDSISLPANAAEQQVTAVRRVGLDYTGFRVGTVQPREITATATLHTLTKQAGVDERDALRALKPTVDGDHYGVVIVAAELTYGPYAILAVELVEPPRQLLASCGDLVYPAATVRSDYALRLVEVAVPE